MNSGGYDDFGADVLDDTHRQRKRERTDFGASVDEDEETTAIKRPFRGEDSIFAETSSVALDELRTPSLAHGGDPYFRRLGYRTTAPYESEYMHVETGSGVRLFAEFEDDEDSPLYDMKPSKFRGHLLGMSIADVKRLAYEDELAVEARKAQLLTVRENSSIVTSVEGNSKLWVDKYAPRTFSDLLSDERTNRNVLIWMKEWSGVVFGKRFSNPMPVNRFGYSGSSGNHTRFSSASSTSSHGSSPFQSGKNATPSIGAPKSAELVEKDRPDKLCILISGPPGIGKTTLAHIISKQAGFEAVEFNASDDRTASTFMPKVLDVVGTESRFGASKPKALIIDEIDGTAGGEGKSAIDALAKFLDERKLKRPIICICNDPWAPSLRPLRERALAFRLDPPSINSLVSRLDHICTREGVTISNQLLQVLCEMTNRDIRSCLNTLQFLSRKSTEITPELFSTSSFGNKDMTSNVFEIWKQVFLKEEKTSSLQTLLEMSARMRRMNSTGHVLPPPTEDKSSNKTKSETERIVSVVKGATLEKVLDGIYENVLFVKYHDPLMENTVALTSWFQHYDDLQTNINKHQQFSLAAYVPYVGSAAHTLCSTSTPHQAIYPRQASLVRATRSVNATTLEQFIRGVAPPFRPYFHMSRLSIDVTSFLIRILSPKLRPVNMSLLTPDEKIKLEILVKIHLAYGLEYVESNAMQWDYPEDEERLARWKKQMESFRGQNAPIPMPIVNSSAHLFALEPPIHRLAHFSHFQARTGGNSAPSTIDFDAANDATRQMIAAQIHSERLARLGSNGKSVVMTEEDIRKAAENIVAKQPEIKKPSSSSKHTTKANDTEIVHRDFFRRVVTPKVETENSSRANNQKGDKSNLAPKSTNFFYKYHEGKTDAVRRKVLMKDLI